MSKLVLTFLCCTFTFCKLLFAGVEITKLDYALDVKKSRVIHISFDGRVVAPPYYVVYDDSVAIKWPNAKLLSENELLKKNVTIKNDQDSLFLIFQGTKALSQNELFKLSLKLASSNITTSIPDEFFQQTKKQKVPTSSPQNSKIEPTVNNAPSSIEEKETKAPEIVNKNKNEYEVKKGNEDYLSYLLSSVDKENKMGEKKVIVNNDENNKNSVVNEIIENKKQNIINKKNQEKDESNNRTLTPKLLKERPMFSEDLNVSSYIFKILFVLGFIVITILLLAKVSKKIIAGKNKLGFLNNSKVVEVLNTTYIGPKRQLLLVKVYDQIILLGNSESGLTFLSEVKELSQVLKFAEKEVTGNNFDSDLLKTNETASVVLKDEKKVFESTPVNVKTSKMGTVLKNKAKAIKAWQA